MDLKTTSNNNIETLAEEIQKLVLDEFLFSDKAKKLKLTNLILKYTKQSIMIPYKHKEDLLQDAVIIMFKCLRGYIPNKGFMFVSYYKASIKAEIKHLISTYESQGMASGWVINHNKSVNIVFETLEDISKTVTCKIDINKNMSNESTEKVMKLFNNNVLDAAIYSAINEFNLNEQEAAKLLCIPFTIVKSAKRRMRKMVLKKNIEN